MPRLFSSTADNARTSTPADPLDAGENALDELKRRTDAAPPLARTIDPAIPQGVEQIIARCLEPDPANRFHTSADLVAALRAVDSDIPEKLEGVAIGPRLEDGSRAALIGSDNVLGAAGNEENEGRGERQAGEGDETRLTPGEDGDPDQAGPGATVDGRARNDGDRLRGFAAQETRRGAAHLRNLARPVLTTLAATILFLVVPQPQSVRTFALPFTLGGGGIGAAADR